MGKAWQKRAALLILLGAVLLMLAQPVGGLLWLNYGALTLHKAVIGEGSAAELAVAESALRKSMAIAPSRAAARNLAFAAYARKDYATALREAARATGQPLALWLAGEAYDAIGDEAKALEAWRDADATPYLIARAGEALKRKDLNEAERLYRSSLALEPTSASALAGLGETLYVESRFDEALMAFGAALEADPGQHRVHFIMGQTHRQLGQNEAALHHFLRAAELEPTITPYADMLVNVYREQGDLAASDRWRELAAANQRGKTLGK